MSDEQLPPKEVIDVVGDALEETRSMGLLHQVIAVLDALRGLPTPMIAELLAAEHDHVWGHCPLCLDTERCQICGDHRKVARHDDERDRETA